MKSAMLDRWRGHPPTKDAIKVTGAEYMHLVEGGTVVDRQGRTITLEDGPFRIVKPDELDRGSVSVKGPLRMLEVKGGEGSGYHDPHYGRPGEVGGSSPRDGGPPDQIAEGEAEKGGTSMRHDLSKTQVEALKGHASVGFSDEVEEHFLNEAQNIEKEDREGKDYLYYSRFRPLGSWANLPEGVVFSGRMIWSDKPLDPETIYKLELGAVNDKAKGVLWRQIYESVNDPPNGDHQAWVFFRQDQDNYKGFVVHPSTVSEHGPWRASTFDLRGFSGHDYYKTPEEAIGEQSGTHNWSISPNIFERIAQMESFRIGNSRTMLRQQLLAEGKSIQEAIAEVEEKYPWPAGTPGIERAVKDTDNDSKDQDIDKDLNQLADELIDLLVQQAGKEFLYKHKISVVGPLRRIKLERHYGPGPHPGTGTEQTVHAGDGGGGKRKVGITSAKPGKESRQVFEEMREFESAMAKLRGVSGLRIKPGVGGWEGGQEPTWVVEFSGDGEAEALIAETAKKHNQDAVLLMDPCGSGEDCQPVIDWEFSDPVIPAERDQIAQILPEMGMGGWTWFRKPNGHSVLRVVSVPQWGAVAEEYIRISEQLHAVFSEANMPSSMNLGYARVRIMEKEGDNAYDRFIGGQ